ncbi:MAG: hypothetical protein ACTHN5_04940 [Phycisphaerae bacterium]
MHGSAPDFVIVEVVIIGPKPLNRPLFSIPPHHPAKIKKPEAHTSGPQHAYRSSALPDPGALQRRSRETDNRLPLHGMLIFSFNGAGWAPSKFSERHPRDTAH